LQAEQAGKWRRRTVLVGNVSTDVEETVLMYLENKRKGGGDIEQSQSDQPSGTLMVTFHDERGMIL